MVIASRRWERVGGDRHLVQEVAIWSVPAGLVGGRLYFLATSWNEVPPHWWGSFAIWDGGLGIWGGIAAGTLAGLWLLRRRGADIPGFLDTAAPALLVAQAIGRIGNYFNQELFGGPSGLPWALEIDPAHRPPGYENYATFHPTFLYELLWNLGLAGALVWLGHHRRIRPGGLFALYVAGYSGFRIFEELLRVDPAHHILGLRLNLYVASVLFLAAVLAFTRLQSGAWPWRAVRRGAALVLVGAAIALAGCGHTGRPAAATSHSTREQTTTWNAIAARIAKAQTPRSIRAANYRSSLEGDRSKQIMRGQPSGLLLVAQGRSDGEGWLGSCICPLREPASTAERARIHPKGKARRGPPTADENSDPAGALLRPASGSAVVEVPADVLDVDLPAERG